MKLTTILTASLTLFGLSACNDMISEELAAVTSETEPNDMFDTANDIGTILDSDTVFDITGSIEVDDAMSLDIEDHFSFLSTIDGSFSITVTPTQAEANILVIEEISATTDGETFNAAGAGLGEVAVLDVAENTVFNFRIESQLADTDYTINVQQAPAAATAPGANQQPEIVVDRQTGSARLEFASPSQD